MLLDEIADYLQSQGIGTVGTNLFKGLMPESPDAAVAVFEYSGLEVQRVQEVAGVAYEQPRIQVMSRAATYAAARQKAEAVYAALATVKNQELSGIRYLRIQPLQPPFLIGRDANSRPLIVFNCQILKVLSSA